MTESALRRGCLVAIGIAAVGLGAIGVVVPLLPTTPFLLLAAACFIRSSDGLYDWLTHHRWFGSYLRNYREHGAVTLSAKVVSLTLLWSAIGYSAVCVARTWWLRGLLAVIAVGVTTHLLLLKTLTSEMRKELEKATDGKCVSAEALSETQAT
jgi:uncharacterized membrane protein YbaN (DUF454 family)